MSTLNRLSIVCLLSVSAYAQSGNLGVFTQSGDVGAPAIKGSSGYGQIGPPKPHHAFKIATQPL